MYLHVVVVAVVVVAVVVIIAVVAVAVVAVVAVVAIVAVVVAIQLIVIKRQCSAHKLKLLKPCGCYVAVVAMLLMQTI